MATNFDPTRLGSTTYRLKEPVDAISFQNTVIEFLDIVRKDPACLVGKVQLITAFCSLLNHDVAWPLAVNVAPELQYPQTHDVSKPAAMNRILQALRHRRPAAPSTDPSNALENEVLKRRIRESVQYIETEGRGISIEQERRDTDVVVERADRIISEYS